MWLQNRHQKIISLLETRQRVSTDALIEEFGVSGETIRRDLMALEVKGLIRRVHGGAVLPNPSTEEPFKKRTAIHQKEKIAIAKSAASLIQPGQTILVDAGTTTSAFATELAKVPDVTVITNSFDIATIMRSAETGVNVLLLGGRVISDVPGTYGELTLSEIARFQVDAAVMSPVALHPEHGAGSYALHEAEVARAMIEHAKKLIMLADHSKLCVSSQVQYCICSQIDILITSTGATKEQVSTLKKAGAKKIIKAS